MVEYDLDLIGHRSGSTYIVSPGLFLTMETDNGYQGEYWL